MCFLRRWPPPGTWEPSAGPRCGSLEVIQPTKERLNRFSFSINIGGCIALISGRFYIVSGPSISVYPVNNQCLAPVDERIIRGLDPEAFSLLGI